MSIPPLGPGVDVVYGPPVPLAEATCGRCGELSCVAVADVSWTLAGPSEVRDGAIVGRACIPDVVASVLDEAAEGTQVSVDLPAWRTEVLAEQIGVTYRQIDHWRRAGYVECEEGRVVGSGFQVHFLADEVARVTRFSLLVSAGLRHDAADRLLRTRPDVAAGVIEALTAPRRELVSA